MLSPQRGTVTTELDGRRVDVFGLRGAEPEVGDAMLRYEGAEARLGAGIGAALDERFGGVGIPNGLC